MATINYYGLTKKGSVTVAMTVTIDQLITAIASDEVLSTEYYTVSAMNNFSKSRNKEHLFCFYLFYSELFACLYLGYCLTQIV
jgi:hypothetical protein